MSARSFTCTSTAARWILNLWWRVERALGAEITYGIPAAALDLLTTRDVPVSGSPCGKQTGRDCEHLLTHRRFAESNRDSIWIDQRRSDKRLDELMVFRSTGSHLRYAQVCWVKTPANENEVSVLDDERNETFGPTRTENRESAVIPSAYTPNVSWNCESSPSTPMTVSAFISSGSLKNAMSASFDMVTRSGAAISFQLPRIAWLPMTITCCSSVTRHAARMR